MKEDNCSLELSKLAKEKGFDWPVSRYYYKHETNRIDLINHGDCINWNKKSDRYISSPTLCYLQKWIENKGYIIEIKFGELKRRNS